MTNEAERTAIRHIAVVAALYPHETNYVETFRGRPSFVISTALALAGYRWNPWHSRVYAWMYNKPDGEL